MNEIWYLATPYNKYPLGRVAAYKDAVRNASAVLDRGELVYSPIAHSHPIHEVKPRDSEVWMQIDRLLIPACHGLIVCKLPGWQESVGVCEEIENFQRRGRTVRYMEAV